VLVKVDKLYFPADFIVLDMGEDKKVPLILGCLFFATNKILIDVQQGKLTLCMQDEEVSFNIFKAMKYPSNNDECYHIDIVDKVMTEIFKEETPPLPLEACIIHSDANTKENFERKECANYLEATTPMPEYGKQLIEELGTSTSYFTPSIQEAPKLELKDLLPYLRYAYLGEMLCCQ